MNTDIKHIMDEDGNHCLVVNGSVGDWVCYESIAKNGNYWATTGYYEEQVVYVIPTNIRLQAVADPKTADRYKDIINDDELNEQISLFKTLNLPFTPYSRFRNPTTEEIKNSN